MAIIQRQTKQKSLRQKKTVQYQNANQAEIIKYTKLNITAYVA